MKENFPNLVEEIDIQVQEAQRVPQKLVPRRNIPRCGELFQAWEMWLSPHSEKPVGSEVGGQDPRPCIGSPVGNQDCIVRARLL